MHHLVIHLLVVVSLARLVEDGVGGEVTRLSGSVVAAAFVDAWIVDVLRSNRAELSELMVRDGEDHFWDNESESFEALRLSERTDIGVERIFRAHDLLGEEMQVLLLTGFTFQVLGLPSIEQGGHEWIVMFTTGKTIKHDGKNHEIVEILACGISEDDTVLKVVVLIMESVLRWGVDTETDGLLESLVTNGERSIEMNASKRAPIVGFRVGSTRNK